jgi:hypothetical protein
LYKGYTEHLLENKGLIKAVAGTERSTTIQHEVIETLRATIKVHDEMLEPNRKERNPNRVTGGKRGRPKGSKSKAVAFGADAMPDKDLVTSGSSADFEAALM